MPKTELQRIAHGIRRKREKKEMLIRLSGEQNHKCCYCGKETVFPSQDYRKGDDLATMEHVIPYMFDKQPFRGYNSYENLVMACYECNDLRGSACAAEDFMYYRTLVREGSRPSFYLFKSLLYYGTL